MADRDAEGFERFRQRGATELFASMPERLDRLGWDSDRLAALQTQRLRTLLAHAISESPYHGDRLRDVDPSRFELADLARLPVMDKPSMMDHYDEVVTDSRLRRADLERLIEATGDEPIPALGEYAVLTSGGSSGTRGIFVMDAAEWAEFVGCSIRPGIAASAAAGGPPREGLDAVVIAAASPIHATAAGSRLSEGGPIRVHRIPATLPFDEIVDGVGAIDPGLVTGYPSVLIRLAREQAAGRLDLHPVAVTCTSENLGAEVRAEIEAAFGVPVANLFGSSEGLIGVSAPGEEPVNFGSDSCIAEPVDEHDEPVPPGTTSAAVLVTNLFNHSQPLIRYRIEDRFEQRPPAAHHGHFRAVVHGRASDVLRWGDVTVHPLTVTTELLHTPAIVDYLVRQTATGLEIDVVSTSELRLDAVGERIALELDRAGVPDADVVVRRIDAIGRDPRTGKVARIVPLASTRR